jgi:tetratricopeptide (TPR) repeat protein
MRGGLAGVLTIVGAIAALSPLAAHAREESGGEARRAHARELFASGSELARANRWRDALAAFERAAALFPHASTTYNIGYCERALGHLTRALQAFHRARAEDDAAPGSLTQAQREALGGYVAQIDERLARLHFAAGGWLVAIDGRPLESTGADVFLAGTARKGPPAPAGAGAFTALVDPGRHVVVVERDGERHVIVRELAPGEDATFTAPVRVPEAPHDEPPSTNDGAWGWDGLRLGGGIAMLAAGTGAAIAASVLAIEAREAWSEAEAACPGLARCPNDVGFDRAADARAGANAATLLFALGAGALVAGGVLVWAARESTAVLEPRLGGAALVGRF